MKSESLDVLFRELYKAQLERSKCSNDKDIIECDSLINELVSSIEEKLEEIKIDVTENL